MIRRPPRSTQSRSSAASDVYKRQVLEKYSCGKQCSCRNHRNAGYLMSRYNATSSGLTQAEADLRYLELTGGALTDDVTISSGKTIDGVDTVSYTHLRAHETRHDIVCRLLLEKKKKKIMSVSNANSSNKRYTERNHLKLAH